MGIKRLLARTICRWLINEIRESDQITVTRTVYQVGDDGQMRLTQKEVATSYKGSGYPGPMAEMTFVEGAHGNDSPEN